MFEQKASQLLIFARIYSALNALPVHAPTRGASSTIQESWNPREDSPCHQGYLCNSTYHKTHFSLGASGGLIRPPITASTEKGHLENTCRSTMFRVLPCWIVQSPPMQRARPALVMMRKETRMNEYTDITIAEYRSYK